MNSWATMAAMSPGTMKPLGLLLEPDELARSQHGIRERSFLTDRSRKRDTGAVGRKPEYDQAHVVHKAARLFGSRGYTACSVDDLVRGLGVHRGSLYRAFGSKRGLFVAALQAHTAAEIPKAGLALAQAAPADRVMVAATCGALDLLEVAAWEASGDRQVAAVVQGALAELGSACSTGAAVEAQRAVGLSLLACRIARRCLPRTELANHLAPLVALVGGEE